MDGRPSIDDEDGRLWIGHGEDRRDECPQARPEDADGCGLALLALWLTDDRIELEDEFRLPNAMEDEELFASGLHWTDGGRLTGLLSA